MGRLLAIGLALALGFPAGIEAAGAPRPSAEKRAARAKPAARARPAPRPQKAPTLAQASAAMRALQRDRQKRRYRHHWERAIADLERAARGKDAARAHLEAARARYALYRWSAIEADREQALALAARASRAGSRDARALAAAIRREAGDDRPARPRVRAAAPSTAGAAPKRTAPAKVAAAPEPEPAAEEEESPPDPALEAALAEVRAPAPVLPLGESGGAGKAHVEEVRAWSSDDYTRVAIYLSHWVGWQKLELAPAAGLPRRLALDLRPAVLDGKAVERAVGGGWIDRVRAAQNDADTVRVVLDLPRRENVQLFGLDDPPRLIVDVGTRPEADEAIANAAPPASTATSTPTATATSTPTATPTALSTPTAPAPTRGIRRIVVDAGHGGHDPGAIGPRRVREKDVTLAMARKLARRLRDAGFEVVLTRDRDRYLALEERTAIANTARGDLFVSIHANAHPRRNRAGIESYYLNVADDRYAARLAARENGLDPAEGEEVLTRILTDLEVKASAGQSRRLAELVQREVTQGVRARVGDVRDLGVKGALFYVLLGARMPAVLVETAFVSNREEERRLASPRYQDEVAAGIARAVVAYARSDSRVASVR
jgi:N-acetylmuramoyl-L-alanine amidase